MVNTEQNRQCSPVAVTNFDLDSLIDQNNLSEDSCLIVVDQKVYDLTLWIQDHLSSDTPPNDHQSRSRSIYSDHSSHPSPPPSPTMNAQPSNQTTQLNPFDNLLAKAKTDPVEAGTLLRSIYDLDLHKPPDAPSLEDWIREYRIGDFSPTTSSSSLPQIPPFDNLPTMHPQLASSYPRAPPHQLPSTDYQAIDQITVHLVRGAERGSSRGITSPGRPTHLLDIAKETVIQLRQQVAAAEQGVGNATLNLMDALKELARAESIYADLQQQALEGLRPELKGFFGKPPF